jgi:putative Holliday junction resolvase
MRFSSITLAVAFFLFAKLQSHQMLAQGVTYQSGAVLPRPPGGLICRLQKLPVEHNLNYFHMWSIFNNRLNIKRWVRPAAQAAAALRCWLPVTPYNRQMHSVGGSSSTPRPRVLSLDVGSKRIGVAISDPLGITAQGLETIHRQNKRLDFEQLERLLHQYEVAEIVVGYPLRLCGTEGIQSEKMQAFAEELRKKFGLPVHLWDERLTSTQANRVLREAELSIKKRGKAVDRLAAVLILQNWMEAKQTTEL